MRKISALVCLVFLFALFCSFAAAEDPASSLKLDPRTGQPYDLGGRTIYLYNFYGGEEAPDPSTPVGAYRTWLMETYNFSFVETFKADWSSIANDLVQFCKNPDGTLCLYLIPQDFAREAVFSNACAKWNQSGQINWNDGKWQRSTIDLMTLGGSVYGVATGRAEPRQCLYFNKRVLEEVGIDWNTLYDMQANNTWTWSAFEDLLSKIDRDTDGDGSRDIFGLVGDSAQLYRIAVFSNGGSFFDTDANGDFFCTGDSAQVKDAVAWANRIWDAYGRKQMDGENWDYFKEEWKTGTCGFYISQTYAGFNDYSEMSDMADAWGCVAFPIGPTGSTYVNIVSDNITVIPNCYSREDTEMLQVIYDLWNEPVEGAEEDWIGNKLNYTDERAVLETYAMLADPAHTVTDKAVLLGNINNVEGAPLFWQLNGYEEDLDGKLASAKETWDEFCRNVNSITPEIVNLFEYLWLQLPSQLATVESEAFAGIPAQVVVVPPACTSIQSRAFADCPNLLYVVLPKIQNVDIAEDAFPEGVQFVYR